MNLNKNFKMRIYYILITFIFISCYFSREKEDPLFLYMLYSSKVEKGEYKEAKKLIEKLIKIKKEREYFRDYIFLLYNIKDFNKLKKVFFEYEKNFEIDSNLTYTFLSACIFTKDFKNFEKYQKKFRERFGKDKNLLYLISVLYQVAGEFDKAIPLLDELIKNDSLNIKKYLIDKARVLSIKKEYKSALLIINKLEENEVTPDILIEKAICLEGLNEYKEALKVYRKLLLIKGVFSKNLLRKALNLSIFTGNYELADTLLKDKIDSLFYDVDFIHQYGFIKYMKNEFKEGMKYFSIALSLNPRDDLAHYYLSRIFYRENLMDRAFYHIKKAIEINSQNYEYYIYYSFLLISERKLREAEELLKEIPDKKNAPYFYLTGFFEKQKGNYKRALFFYEKSLKIDSLDARKWFETGALYEEINDIRNAQRAFRKSVILDSSLSELYNYWGYMLAERGLKLDTAKILVEKALKYEPDNGYYLDSMGWVYYMMGKYDSAFIYLKRAVDSVPDDPVIVEHLGDVYLKLNQVDRAINYWEEALKLEPDNKNLKKKIEKYKSKGI